MINKGKFAVILVLVLSLTSCISEDQKKARESARQYESKSKELKCKGDFAVFILENGLNIKVLAKKKGMSSELADFEKLRSDSLVTCDSIRKSWSKLSSEVLKK